MKKHLVKVRKEDIAFDDEEYWPGVRAVAAGIRNADGRLLGSISMVAPSVRLSLKKMRKLAYDVKDCAMQISKEFGGKTGEK